MRKLDPQLESWLQVYNRYWQELELQGFQHSPQNARDGLAKLTQQLVTKFVDVAAVIDTILHKEAQSIPLRIYQPLTNATLPILVYLHGGGHMSGSVEVYDRILRQIALASGHIVVAVEYRLAPEFPYPCALEDAEWVIRHLFSHLDGLSIDYQPMLSIAGDSAGGAMTATLAHRFQQHASVKIYKQLLIYPSLDYSLCHESLEQNGRGYLLHKDKIEWFFSRYLQHGEDAEQVSPLYMTFSNRLPETLVITAEFCPLRDEGFEYVKQLKRAGVPVSHMHFEDMIHAFMNMQDVVPEQCALLYQQIAEFLNNGVSVAER